MENQTKDEKQRAVYIFDPALVNRARKGDEEAVTMLYSRTYSSVFWTIRSLVKNEEDAADILQDTYIKAFQKLDQLQEDGAFLSWLKMSAVNNSKNWLEKKKPVLFTEFENDENENSFDESIDNYFEDTTNYYQPEAVMDANETTRLLDEILDDLPDDQRAAISMYYYDEMSIAEIASQFNVSEGTIKSRLNYGRKRVKEKVLEMEKHGTKLYSFAPFVFLLFLFHNTKAEAAGIQPDAKVLQNILINVRHPSPTVHNATETIESHKAATDVAGKAASAAAGAGTKAAGTSAAIKIAGIIAAVSVTGAAAAVIGNNRNEEHIITATHEAFADAASSGNIALEESDMQEEQSIPENSDAQVGSEAIPDESSEEEGAESEPSEDDAEERLNLMAPERIEVYGDGFMAVSYTIEPESWKSTRMVIGRPDCYTVHGEFPPEDNVLRFPKEVDFFYDRNTSELIERHEYEYDEEGRIIKDVRFNPWNNGEDRIGLITTFTYRDGLPESIVFDGYNGNGEKAYLDAGRFEYEYDDDGNIIRKHIYSTSGELDNLYSGESFWEYLYDEGGHLQSATEINFDQNGEEFIGDYVEFKVSDRGDIEEFAIYTDKSKARLYKNVSYTYTEEGILLEVNIVQADIPDDISDGEVYVETKLRLVYPED